MRTYARESRPPRKITENPKPGRGPALRARRRAAPARARENENPLDLARARDENTHEEVRISCSLEFCPRGYNLVTTGGVYRLYTDT